MPRQMRSQDALTEDELRALMATFSTRSPNALRGAALVATMAEAGLRLSELLALRLEDLRYDAGVLVKIVVQNGKGGRPRTLQVSPRLLIPLARWLEARKDLEIPGPWIFCTFHGGTLEGFGVRQELEPGRTLSPRYVQQLVARQAKKAGIQRRVTPHTLRHTFATRLLRSCGNLETVRKAMGHTSILTTSDYYAHLVQDDVDTAITELGTLPEGR